MPNFVMTWGSAIIIAVAWLLVSLSRRNTFKSLPGPRQLPLLGNALQMPKSHEWVKYAQWGETYGPIFQIRLFGQSVVIINSHKAAIDLLEKKSAMYSDRPRLVMAGELMGWNRAVTLIESNERHRRYRRLLQSTLSKAGSHQFYPLQQGEAYAFLQRLLVSPDQLVSHIRRTVAGSIVKIAYGHTITSNADEYITQAEDAQAKFSIAATPNTYLVDSLSFLKFLPAWFPGARFKRDAFAWRRELDSLTQHPFQRVKHDVDWGTAAPSYVSQLLEKSPKGTLTLEHEEDIMFSALSLYTGGADTTVSSIHTFFLAMCLYPRVQSKAQAELDLIIGRDRLPSFADRDTLPYLSACVKEVFRWQPALPLGVAHRLNQEDEYDGYRIPAGSTIISNIWAMMQDKSVYAEPHRFQPERWLNGKIDSIQHNFGFGRRICPGMWTADASLFIVMACVLATFNIKPVLGIDGKEILPHVQYTTGMISHPEPFDLRIVPRSGQTVDLIGNQDL